MKLEGTVVCIRDVLFTSDMDVPEAVTKFAKQPGVRMDRVIEQVMEVSIPGLQERARIPVGRGMVDVYMPQQKVSIDVRVKIRVEPQ